MPSPPDDLTFSELRLANLMRKKADEADFAQALTIDIPAEDLAQTLAASVIEADWLAAARDIDLAQAIRARFDPVQGVVPPMQPARREAMDAIVRKRTG